MNELARQFLLNPKNVCQLTYYQSPMTDHPQVHSLHLQIPQPNRTAYLTEAIQQQNSSNPLTSRQSSVMSYVVPTPTQPFNQTMNTLMEELQKNRYAIQRLESAIERMAKTLENGGLQQGGDGRDAAGLREEVEESYKQTFIKYKSDHQSKQCTPIEKTHKNSKQTERILSSVIKVIDNEEINERSNTNLQHFSRRLEFDVVSDVSSRLSSQSIISRHQIKQPKINPKPLSKTSLTSPQKKSQRRGRPSLQKLSAPLFLFIFIVQLSILITFHLIFII